MLLTAVTKCFQILEKVFSDDMEGDTAMQVSVVDGFFFLVAVFFIFALLSFPGRCVSWCMPRKGTFLYIFLPPLCCASTSL